MNQRKKMLNKRKLILTKLTEERVSIYTSRYDFICNCSYSKLMSSLSVNQIVKLSRAKLNDETMFLISESIIDKCEEK